MGKSALGVVVLRLGRHGRLASNPATPLKPPPARGQGSRRFVRPHEERRARRRPVTPRVFRRVVSARAADRTARRSPSPSWRPPAVCPPRGRRPPEETEAQILARRRSCQLYVWGWG